MTTTYTTRDLQKGFWYYRPDEHFPPPSVTSPDAYAGTPHLSIAGTRAAAAQAQSRITEQWARILPTLGGVRVLWISMKVSQKLFESVCGMRGLEGLWIKSSGIRSLEPLLQLRALESFHLGSSPAVESIEPLSRMPALRWLELENLRNVRDLSPIGACAQLVGLGITGSMWTPQRVDSLAPLGRLGALKHLNLANLRAADNTLEPLYGLSGLQHLTTPSWFPANERQALRRHNTALEF